MISLGIPTMYITRRLGHSSDDMVKRVYGHIIADKQDDVNRQMSEFFK
jgi:integrase